MFDGHEDKTLREVVSKSFQVKAMGLVGSPATVAAKMGEIMDEAGGDGFLFYLPTTRMNLAMVSDGLAPELRRRGLIREEYTGSTLKENLIAF